MKWAPTVLHSLNNVCLCLFLSNDIEIHAYAVDAITPNDTNYIKYLHDLFW